jgi:hypothetical protein
VTIKKKKREEKMSRMREGSLKLPARGKGRHEDISKKESSDLNETGPHPLREEDSNIT